MEYIVTIDEFAASGITCGEDIAAIFRDQFFFGCEADDPMNASAFDVDRNPYGTRLSPVFGSDIGHWDVPEMNEVVEEAHELVDKGVIENADFRDFVFVNPARFVTRMNPNYFKGTVVEDTVAKLTSGGGTAPASAAPYEPKTGASSSGPTA